MLNKHRVALKTKQKDIMCRPKCPGKDYFIVLILREKGERRRKKRQTSSLKDGHAEVS